MTRDVLRLYGCRIALLIEPGQPVGEQPEALAAEKLLRISLQKGGCRGLQLAGDIQPQQRPGRVDRFGEQARMRR